MKIAWYDIETKKQVNNWDNLSPVELDVACVHNNSGEKKVFFSPEKLVEELNIYDRVVGFNNHRFDDKLLVEKVGKNLPFLLNSIDLLKEIEESTDIKYATSLEDLGKSTLGRGKSDDGSNIEDMTIEQKEDYCHSDCKLLKDIYNFAAKHGYVLISPNKADLFGDLKLKVNLGGIQQ